MNHSVLPWKEKPNPHRGDHPIATEGGHIVAYVCEKRDAEYIVKSANAYPKLVDLLKELVCILDGNKEDIDSFTSQPAEILLKELGEL